MWDLLRLAYQAIPWNSVSSSIPGLLAGGVAVWKSRKDGKDNKKQIDTLQTTTLSLTASLTQAISGRLENQKRIQELEARCAAYDELASRTKGERDSISQELEKVQGQFALLHLELLSERASKVELQEKVSALEEKVAHLTSQLSEKDKLIFDLRDQLQETKLELERVKGLNSNLTKVLSTPKEVTS